MFFFYVIRKILTVDFFFFMAFFEIKVIISHTFYANEYTSIREKPHEHLTIRQMLEINLKPEI